MVVRVYLVILLFLMAATTAAGPRSFAGSLRLKLSSSPDRPLKNVAIQIQFGSTSSGLYPSLAQFQLSTDSSGSAQIEIPPGTYNIRVEVLGFEDQSLNNLTIKEGEITEVDALLDEVEELRFMRLADDELNKLFRACRQDGSWKVEHNRLIINDAQRWADLWTEYKLVAPAVDFKKWRAVGGFRRISEYRPAAKVRRVTYNPKQEVTRVRYEFVPHGPDRFYSQVISCVGELILIPPRPGDVEF